MPCKRKKVIAIWSICAILVIVSVISIIVMRSGKTERPVVLTDTTISREWTEASTPAEPSEVETTNADRALPGMTVRGEPLHQ